MKTLDITIAVQCHNFEYRLAWMLESLSQQRNLDNNLRILVIVDWYHQKKGLNSETLATYYTHLHPFLSVTSYWWDTDYFQYRGIVRNRQIQTCESKYLLFADCDMVYSPVFFENLRVVLSDEGFDWNLDQSAIMTAGRMSVVPHQQLDPIILSKPQKLGSNWYETLCETKVYETVNSLKLVERSNVGAGFFQLINMDLCNHGREYVDPTTCRDRKWSGGADQPKSDIQFRKKIGKKVKLPHFFTANQIHLNHERNTVLDNGQDLQK